ncbi:MAG TPA: alpha/beta hydrolase, partial [Chthoniobacterales bacterium]
MWLVAFVLAAVLALVALIYFRQHNMIYHPRPYGPEFANSLPPGVVELRYSTIAGAQSAFYLPRGAEQPIPSRIWVAFPGNGSFALDWLALIARDPNPTNAYLLVDYPGYGRNEGYAAIATNRAVADGALEALEKHLGLSSGELDSRLNIIGHSFGCGAGLDFASRHSANRMVLVAPFTSLREAAVLVVGELLSHLLIENYDNRARLHELAERENPPR